MVKPKSVEDLEPPMGADRGLFSSSQAKACAYGPGLKLAL